MSAISQRYGGSEDGGNPLHEELFRGRSPRNLFIRPYTNEEIVTRDFILNEKPDGIINIVDATNIERNLYLTLQLQMHIPMVLALNMMDEVRGNGGSIDYRQMSQELGDSRDSDQCGEG